MEDLSGGPSGWHSVNRVGYSCRAGEPVFHVNASTTNPTVTMSLPLVI
jgi:hypothetical protein